ncbi:MAG: NADH-quinone oxidoreductase subunit C [Clostridia bacterium]|nr:NADH-quinone oxidoreductase subunit C [Clostridia bacterium]
MIENMTEIAISQLLSETQKMKYEDYRFVTASCVSLGDDGCDVIYHFDKDLEMKHLKLRVGKGEELPSVSKIYFCALLVENEMKELFGINITDIAVDYGGHMLLSDEELESPMAKQQITIVEKKGAK